MRPSAAHCGDLLPSCVLVPGIRGVFCVLYPRRSQCIQCSRIRRRISFGLPFAATRRASYVMSSTSGPRPSPMLVSMRALSFAGLTALSIALHCFLGGGSCFTYIVLTAAFHFFVYTSCHVGLWRPRTCTRAARMPQPLCRWVCHLPQFDLLHRVGLRRCCATALSPLIC